MRIVWCEFNDKPCIYPEPDDLENCRYCPEYDRVKAASKMTSDESAI